MLTSLTLIGRTYEPTQYGLANAISEMSQHVEDYDRATELERISGNVLTLDDSQWNRLVRG